MLFRRYMPQDFQALYAIEEVCFRPPLRFGRRYMRRLVDSRSTATWIAEDDGQMAGFSIVELSWEIGAVVAYIQTIEVLPSERGKGIGSELLNRMEESARAAGGGRIWLHVDEANAGAIRLYQAHGYGCEGREENYYAAAHPALIYGKPIERT